MGKKKEEARKQIECIIRELYGLRMGFGCITTGEEGLLGISEEEKLQQLEAMTSMIKYFEYLLDTNKISSDTAKKLKAWKGGKNLYGENEDE